MLGHLLFKVRFKKLLLYAINFYGLPFTLSNIYCLVTKVLQVQQDHERLRPSQGKFHLHLLNIFQINKIINISLH